MIPIRKSNKARFSYQERTVEDMQERQRSFAGRDSYFSKDAKFYITKPGANKIRILPPTWDKAKHYGHDIYVHYGIGPDNVGYLCLDRTYGEVCSLCNARSDADKSGDDDLAKALRATRRVAVYVIDRNAEGEGPKVWPMPQTVDKEICAQAWDKDSGEVYAVDNPDEGYDVSFEVEGQGQTKKYVGVRLARRGSPLSDDDKTAEAWLQHIVDHPIPDMLVPHTAEEMQQAFEGKSAKDKQGDEDDTTRKSTKLRDRGERAEDAGAPSTRPRIGSKKPAVKPDDDRDEDVLPTWAEVHEMDGNALGDLAEEHSVDFGTREFASLEDCQDWVCKKLKIEEKEANDDDDTGATRGKGTAEGLKERLRHMTKKK